MNLRGARAPYRFRLVLLLAPLVFLRAVDFLLEVDFRPVLRLAELPPGDFLAEDVREPAPDRLEFEA